MLERNVDYAIRRELKTFYCDLAVDVQKEHRARCPCCGNPMSSRKRDRVRDFRNAMSIAHNIAVGYGGNPEVWVYACRGCNQDQGGRSFTQWANDLAREGDRRASRVRALAVFIDNWLDERGISPLVYGRNRRDA